jgi:hypothetical protein
VTAHPRARAPSLPCERPEGWRAQGGLSRGACPVRVRWGRGPARIQAAWTGDEVSRTERAEDSGVVLRWSPTVPFPRTPMGAPPVRPGGSGMPLPTLMCVDSHRGIPRGASAYLLLTGGPPGLIARGGVLCAPFLAARLDRPGTVGQHVLVEWTQYLGIGDRSPLEILQDEIPEVAWQPLEVSVVPLTTGAATRVRRLWLEWIERRAGESQRRCR